MAVGAWHFSFPPIVLAMSRHDRPISVQSTASMDTLSRAFDKFANISQTVKEFCPRIRILVMGRRNAGKTTLLQRMTQSSDGRFVLRGEDGKLVSIRALQQCDSHRHIPAHSRLMTLDPFLRQQSRQVFLTLIGIYSSIKRKFSAGPLSYWL